MTVPFWYSELEQVHPIQKMCIKCSLTPISRNKAINTCLTAWRRVLGEKLVVTHTFKKFLTFHGSQMYVTVFTIPYHWTRARAVQYKPSHPISLRSMLLCSLFCAEICYVLSSLRVFWPKFLYISHISHAYQ